MHLWRVSSIGIELAVATAIGWGLGLWADTSWDSAPWGQAVGLGFGVAAGMKGVLREARRYRQQLRAEATASKAVD
jgi:F0F1-type ATP synthase assembly protein I